MTLTWWRNPTSEAVSFRIFEGPGQWLTVSIAPGEATQIPSIHDAGLQEWRDGRIVGGLAPNLEKLDGPPPPPLPPPAPEPAVVEKPSPRKKG